MNEKDIFEQFKYEHNQKLNENEKEVLFETIQKRKKKKKNYFWPLSIPAFCFLVISCCLLFLPKGNKNSPDDIQADNPNLSAECSSIASSQLPDENQYITIKMKVLQTLEDVTLYDIQYHSYLVEIIEDQKEYFEENQISIYTTQSLVLEQIYDCKLSDKEGHYFVF